MRRLLKPVLTAVFVFGMATSAFAAYSGPNAPDTPLAPGYTAPLSSSDVDNGIGNANSTGKNAETNDGTTVNDVIKSRDMRATDLTGGVGTNQRTHGSYQNNTNSCASCHQTHTGASKDLLFKQGVYNTCTACHDGTLGFYNVYATGDQASTAGTFGGTTDGNASVHLAEGIYIEHAFAPGGNNSKTGANTSTTIGNGAWGEKFDCASCHSPHGSYSDRLLHYNPNGMAAVPVAQGGQKVSGNVETVLPAATATSPDFVILRTVSDAPNVNIPTTQEPAGTPVIVLMKKQSPSTGIYEYVWDKTPWLYGYQYYSAPYYTNFKDAAGQEIKTIEKEYGFAYAKGTGLASAVTADISRVYVVKLAGDAKQKDGSTIAMPMQVIKNFGGIPITKVNTDIYDEAGYGVAIGKYCGACHTDYLAASAGARKSDTSSGMYTQAYRHTTNNDRYTCLKCHFAHGTDVTVMRDAQDRTLSSFTGTPEQVVAFKEYLTDKNPSSALKRYTNMAVCWKCHTDSKAEQLKNNQFFWDNYGTVPHGGSTGAITGLEHNW